MQVATKQAFDLLGVKPTDDAATIRAAWRALVRSYHPDRIQGDKAAANARLAELNAAYDAVMAAGVPAQNATRAKAEVARRAAERRHAEEARARAAAAREAVAAARTEKARQAEAQARADAQALRAAQRAAEEQAEKARREAAEAAAAPARSDVSAAEAAFAAARQVFNNAKNRTRIYSRRLYA